MAGEAVVGALRVVIGADTADLDKGLKAANDNVSHFGDGVSRAGKTITDAMKKIGESFGIDISPLQKGLSETSAKMSATAGSAEKLGLVAGLAIAGLAVGVVAATTAIVSGLGHAIDRADEMSKASQKFGVPIEQLSALAYAADLADVSFEGLGTGLAKLGRNMSDVAGGATSDASKAFTALGISVTDSSGKLKTTNQVLSEVADKFSVLEDGAAKTALAMAIFGRSGAELIPLLNGGSEALAKMTDEAQKMGLVFSKEVGAAAEEFNDSLNRLGKLFYGFSNSLLPTLLPYLTDLAVKMSDAAIESEAMKNAGESVANAIVNIVQSAIAGYQALEVFAKALNAVNMAANLIGQWNFSGAFEALRLGLADVTIQADAALKAFQAIGSPETNPFANPTTMQVVSDAINFKLTAPIIKSTEATKKATEATDEWGRKIDEASVKKRAMDLIVGAQEPWVQYNTAIAKADSDLIKFGATNEQIGAVHKQIAEKYQNTWAQVAPAVAGSFQQIAKSFEGSSKSMAAVAKIAGIVQATISMFVGAAKALELPFPANLAAGAAVLAQGAALVAQVKGVGGFATGGSFRVGGAGGFDNQKVMMDLSPGEQVDVWRPGEDPRGGGQSGPPITIAMTGEMFSQKQIRRLIHEINQASRDGSRIRLSGEAA